jgi:hypothetical protein
LPVPFLRARSACQLFCPWCCEMEVARDVGERTEVRNANSYSISRLNARPTQMHASQKNHPLSLNTHKIVNEEDMRKALAEIESSEAPDYAIIARKYGLTRSMLSRRARGLITSRAEF